MADDAFYLQAMRELQSGEMDEALYAKMLVRARGDVEKASFDYVEERVKRLANEQDRSVIKLLKSDPKTLSDSDYERRYRFIFIAVLTAIALIAFLSS